MRIEANISLSRSALFNANIVKRTEANMGHPSNNALSTNSVPTKNNFSGHFETRVQILLLFYQTYTYIEHEVIREYQLDRNKFFKFFVEISRQGSKRVDTRYVPHRSIGKKDIEQTP
jgi:hypothetical protein